MSKALSLDLREQVVAAIAGGMSSRFGVSASSAIRWRARVRVQGDVKPKALGGDHRSARIEGHAAFILRLVEDTPDMTLVELRSRLAARGVGVGRATASAPPRAVSSLCSLCSALAAASAALRSASARWRGSRALNARTVIPADSIPMIADSGARRRLHGVMPFGQAHHAARAGMRMATSSSTRRMIGRIEETSASFEARSAPRTYPTSIS